MSEPSARSHPPRGRGSGRGGRGGYSTRGGRPRQAAGGKQDFAQEASFEDEGEIGQLKKQYAPKLNTIREMFPDWTDEDIVFALHETDGDLEATIERISEGNVSQWGEVKKKTKDRAKPKPKGVGTDGHDVDSSARAGRGRGSDSTRGRARAAERGRGAGRGRGGAVANGSKKPAEPAADSAPAAEESVSWSAAADAAAAEKQGSVSPDASWEVVTPSEAAPPAVDAQKPSAKPDGKRSWASMLKPAVVPKPQPAPAKPKVAATPAVQPTQAKEKMAPAAGEPEIGKAPDKPPHKEPEEEAPVAPLAESALHVSPSKDELTETNLEQVQDVSNPVASETVASNAGTNDVRSTTDSAAPSQTPQPAASGRAGLGGFATTAHKATVGSGRASSFQRRVKDQQEAVVMPGHHAVDRAAVQFGSLGLGEQEDVDGDREEPETRTQPPQHSPVAPRASLPPAAQQAAAEATVSGTRPAPGLPPVAAHVPQGESGAAPQGPGANYGYNQFNSIYGGGVSQGEAAAAQTKAFDSFAQHGQPAVGHGFDSYPPHTQSTSQGAPQQGALTTASDYPSYYSSDSQRNAYQGYYGAYGQQAQPGSQDNATAQQKAGATHLGTAADSQASAAGAQNQSAAQNRFPGSNEAQPSGNSTPNPPLGQQGGQGPQSHQINQGQAQAGAHGYPYGGSPYYNHPYYSTNYMNQMNHHQYGPERPPFDDARRYDEYGHGNQYGYAQRHSGYGTGPYGGAGKYGQPHSGYGMTSQSPFDAHSASPGNASAYGQPQSMPGRDNAGGLGGYGRTNTTQPSESQSHTSGAFGGMSDVFSRSQSGFSTQTSQQQSSQQGAGEDSSRGFGDTSKIAGGPSPAPGQTAARPGSAANLPGQSNLPTSQAQGYSGYPSQMGQMHGQQSQYGTGLGGLGGHGGHHQGGGHQSNAYGYSGFGAGNYYGNSNRGGWGGNYGH